jgi:hypothetical protein
MDILKALKSEEAKFEKMVRDAQQHLDTVRSATELFGGKSKGTGGGKKRTMSAATLVEVSNDGIASLFIPYGNSSGRAFLVNVHCDDLEITEIPQGDCPIRLKVLKRYGADVQLGEITKWEDRHQPAAFLAFTKGDNAASATFNKPGTSDQRSLHIYVSKHDSNSFLLEASSARGVERLTGNNIETSNKFMVMCAEFFAEGFTRNNFRSGDGKYRLIIW